MKSRVQAKRIPEHKLQAANSIAESLEACVNRALSRFCFAKIMSFSLRDESIFFADHEHTEETDLQKNLSLLNDSRHFDRDNQRQMMGINPVTMDPQRSQKIGFDHERVSQFNPTRLPPQQLNNIKEEPSAERQRSEAFYPKTSVDVEKGGAQDSLAQPAYESANLRIGDIVYFKTNVEVSAVGKKGKVLRLAGILSGDGIASNRLECIDREITSAKNANFLFKKSLFRVEPARKYYYQKLYNNMQAQRGVIKDANIVAELDKKLEVIKEKYEEEKEENDSDFKAFLGQNILYGQTIHLKHLYSDCYLTYQNNSLALQYGCIRLTLEEEGSEYSNFKFMASGNLKSKEDVVAYSDPIHVVSARGNYFMHVWDENNDLLGNNSKTGLEVNGSESSSDWKIIRFLDFAEFQEYEDNNAFLESGNIVRLKHKKTNTALFAASRDLQPVISTRTITLNNELEDNFGAQRISYNTKFINGAIQAPVVHLARARKYTISDLWEVQRGNAFIGGFARFEEAFRLKNVATGLFLCRDPDSDKLTLTKEGNRRECYFYFQPNKTTDKKHRIEFGDLMRVQTLDRSFLQKSTSKSNSGVTVGPKITDTTNLLFFMEYSPTENSDIANRLSSLFPCFLNFHIFLQQWGLKDQTTYDYTKSLEHEKSLGVEVDQLLEGLENLEDFLASKSTFPFKIKQNLLIEQKIIEILLLIIELINAKVHTHTNQKNAKDAEDKVFKIFEENNEDEWELLEKTPQYIARKHLQSPIKRIYKILLLGTKNSPEVSALFLKNSKFLSKQLAFYREEAGALLKEAIKNSANFGDLDPNGDQIAKWLGLLEMIKETEGNVQLQTLYVEIISLACLNHRKKGILKYQNRVVHEFFAPGAHFLKNILTFTKIDGMIYCSFGKDNADMKKEEFLENNYSFTGNEVEYKDYQGKYFFSLEDLSSKKTADLELIVNYIGAVLSLYYSICKDRNESAIERVKGMGLQRDVLESCMNNLRVHIKLKKQFVLLYRVLFMDIDPFQTIKEASNHCYLWDEVDQKNLADYTYTWHNLANGNNLKSLKYYDRETTRKICEYISNFWVHGTGIRIDSELHLNDQEFLENAELIYSMLLFTKTAVNLGFTDAATNNQILYSLVNLFAMFDRETKDPNAIKSHSQRKAPKRSKLRENGYWVSRFVQANPLSTKDDTFGYIYLEALEIFKMIGELRLNLQMTGFLKIFKLWHEEKPQLPPERLKEVFEVLFKKYGLSVPVPNSGHLSHRSDDENLDAIRFRSMNEQMSEKVKAIIREIGDHEADDHIQSGLVFINMLFEDPDVNKYITKPTRDVLKSFFDQRECLLENVKNIEIISGDKEKEIYAELDSLNDLGTLVSHMLQDEDSIQRKQDIDQGAYRDRVSNINIAITRIISYFKERKKDIKLTLKTQNIMRNLEIHTRILDILKVEYRAQDHKEMFTLAIDALFHFCKKNKINQQALLPHVSSILILVEKGLKPAKLISQIFSYNKESKECHNLIEVIFDHLAVDEEKDHYKSHCQYIIMLRNFIVDEKKNGIKENQRRVMGRLMTNKNFLSVLNFRPFTQSKNADLKDEELAELRYQSECMLLLANLTLETQLGMVQAKKTLSYDQIKSLLINNLTPYVQKRSFLRCLFQIYIVKYGSLNDEFDKKTMIDILNSVVIPDLKSFDKYVEGVIEIPSESDKIERQKKALELRERVKRFRGRLSDYEGRDDINNNASAVMRKLLPPITSQADAKKIIRDASEYWEYLNSGKSWNMSQDGLLYFIMDCFHEIEIRNWMIDENLKEVLSNIKLCLGKMNTVLLKVEEEINREGPTMKLTKFTVLISECIDRLPGKKVVRLGKSMHVQSDGKSYNFMKDNTKQEEYEIPSDTQSNKLFEIIRSGDPVSIMLIKIKSYILKKKMSLEDFMLLFWNTEDRMPAYEFKSKLKSILGNSVTPQEISEFISSIHHYKKDPTAADGTVSLSKVYRKLQKSLERDRSGGFNDAQDNEEDAALEDQFSSQSAMVSKDLQAFIGLYAKLSVGREVNHELNEVIGALFAPNKKTISKKRLERIQSAVTSLISTFHKREYEIYILRMLQYTLKGYQHALSGNGKPVENEDSDDEDQTASSSIKIGDFEKIQLMAAQSDALSLCLKYIKEGVPKKLGLEAVRVLNLMLSGGSKHVQTHILEFLKSDPITSGFFNYIKLQLWETVDIFKKITEEKEKMKKEGITEGKLTELSESEIELEFKLTEEVIRLMQLFCENCFNGFQNFLRVQVTNTQQAIVPSNLVNELSSFLIDLQLADPQVFERPEMSRLVLASLETLIDFCTGPCEENQVLLGNQRHLISFLNSSLDKNINFAVPDNLQMIKVFGAIIKFLLSLITGNNDSATKEFLLGQLHTDSLIKKLVLIYNTKIISRDLEIFRQERTCPQKRDGQHLACEKNFCMDKLLTPGDNIIIETVFNLYIILIIFNDEFPENPKLEKFRNDRLRRDEREQLKHLTVEYHKHKAEKYKKAGAADPFHHTSSNVTKNLTFALVAPKSSTKIVPSTSRIAEDDSTVLLRDAQSPEIASPPLEISKHLRPQSAQPSQPPKNSALEEHFKEDFVRRLMRQANEENSAKLVHTEEAAKPEKDEEEAFKEYHNLTERHTLYKARKFFRTFINSVEITRDEKISKNYFQVPFECDYMTENIREHLIFKANRNSDAERLEYFSLNVPLYQKELKHRQRVSRTPVLDWFIKRWRLFKDIAYVLVVANNLVLLITLEIPDNNDNDLLNLIFSILQAVLSVIVVIFSVIERLPISLYEKPFSVTKGQRRKAELKKNLAIEKNTTSLFDSLWTFVTTKKDIFLYSDKQASQMSYRGVILKIIKDRENLYNLIYLAVSITAFATDPLVYSILMLDIVKRSDDLQNIIKSITYNITQLIKTCILGLIVMYFYAIISFRWFRPYFKPGDGESSNMNCDRLLDCWTSIVNYGTRSGGGIGDVMGTANLYPEQDEDYWARWAFDLTFFVLVIIILLNIIFGIIIDTFADLRDQRHEELQKITGSCFICGVERYDFDTKGNGWYDHIYREHNIYAYLNFFIYIKNKKLTECNGIEKYVKELMEKNDISFIPQQTALVFQE